ncbi:hypothetical protein [Rufibacter latericius]|uniref:Lipoprotein n=1 Tax=Rufibacter latericius TaxID=2487040 RepID=A0A3M9MFM4_9BACT|nr:hypothetical protein [Rufibacter latericius]RNI23673.1 hypothetical protein EFB08_19300 [Rufibacter latericius]
MLQLLPFRFWVKKSTFVLLSSVILLGSSACEDEGTTAPVVQRTHQAYDLVSFLDQEAQALMEKKATVRKTVSEAGKIRETKTFPSLNWTEELAPFADADINKPALTGLFNKETSSNAMGQQVIRYKAKEDASTNVQEVTYTLDAKGQLVQLDAVILQENMMFNTKKLLHLEAHSGPSPRVVRYHLDETQKLLFMGAERYSVTGEVIP